MAEEERDLSFDFEGGLDSRRAAKSSAAFISPILSSSVAIDSAGGGVNVSGAAARLGQGGAAGENPPVPGQRSFRQTVCRHWIRGLCAMGEACGFLHQYDTARMPVCRFFSAYGECRDQDCVFKHTNEDSKECNMYKLGFCPNGPDCHHRHAKLPGPPPPIEDVFQKIQQISSYSSNNLFQHRNGGLTQPIEKPIFSQITGALNSGAATKASAALKSTNIQDAQPQQQQLLQVQQPQRQQTNQNQIHNLPNSLPNQTIRTALPLPQGQSRYFIVKSCNRENLELSVQRGVWATQKRNEAKLNEAFESSENVILIFSINQTRHFQGCAKMTSKIGGFVGGGNWKYAHGTPQYGHNFSVKWLKLGELSFHKTHHLRNPCNENLPVKISRDCQELEPFVGLQLVTLLYDEPDSELWTMLIAAESKQEEEKVKGVNVDYTPWNPDNVPFEDNEEDEEEEGENFGQGTGRGKGIIWPPLMFVVPRGRPMLPDGFGFGGVTPGGFPAPDLFAPRMFPPYGHPRYGGDLSGLVFPGRPTQPGVMFQPACLGVMMGATPSPFLGCMPMVRPNAARANRPRMPPPSLPLTSRAPKRNQKKN